MPSITVSPMVATMPPSTFSSTTTLTSTLLVRRLAERGGELLHLRVVERYRRPHLGDLVLPGLGGELDEALDDRGEVVTASGRHDERDDRHRCVHRAALEQLLDDRGAPLGGQRPVRERHAQLVVALDDPREAEQLVLDLTEVALGLARSASSACA